AVSDGHSLTTLIAPPATPGNFALNIFSDAQVDLSWSDVQNEDGYMIYFATAQAGIYEVLGQVGADENTYSHLLDIPGTVYYYKVSAFNATGSSGLTAPLNPLPLTPTGFTAVAVAGGIINLNWNAVGSAEGYRIYRQIQGQPSFVELTTTAADVTTYQDTGLAGFVLHYYKIASYNAFGESPLSSLVYALALP
ncbi:MAG: fibronectin type III domain-containing protein, partial [FCB group bacterium]|nr:fibronectin type III domain-containing protein [FCB group bacterium]